ncbi:MAG: cobyric acid synthase [Bacteroidaceae bacterium]|nr:cobyric acid synthase [Bacteroidaceae bacterium]
MLQGHGDDAYRYSGIRHNFSSNIFSHADLGGLKIFIASKLDAIGTYPEPEPRALEHLIAERCGVSEECVLVTSGATEAIYLIAQTWRDMPYRICQPTFSEYADACQALGSAEGDGGIIWLCNPNNPTGSVIPKAGVMQMSSTCSLLVVDQSYEDYTLAPLLSPAEAVAAGDILQLHSLTKKYCIPGLRIGYVVGAPALIEQLRRRLHPWSVNALAIEAASWLIRNNVSVLPGLKDYLAEAQRLQNALNALESITVEPTLTNFMLCRLDERVGISATELKEHLATRHGILIRDASNFEGLTPYHFRVAAQTKEENGVLIEKLRLTIDEYKLSGPQKGYSKSSLDIRHSSPRPLMLCGTGSDVGKSVIATALCRIFLQDGHHPAPFKAQNMALNSYATPEGLEIGRAQAVQAEAAGIPCHTDMNPLLLKPNSDHTSQVVLNGKPLGNRDAYDYWRKRDASGPIDFRAEVCKAFDRLAARYSPIVMEGAGSISELNLRDTDLVNLPMARHADAAVILVADIDRGGVFASVYGSIALQTPEDRARIRGIIINKFRGDLRLFDDGRRMIEELTGVPVLGVIPYYKGIYIEEEDSVSLEQKRRHLAEGKVNIAVVLLRHISNFTDFDTLERDSRVNLFYTNNVDDISRADIIILPGTKATLDDLLELRRNGCAQAILRAHRDGKTVVGICGGYQMLGQAVNDPDGIEGTIESLPGLGLLPISTTMTPKKTTQQVTFIFDGQECQGYEIHQGVSDTNHAILQTDHCIGTYIHGFLDNAPVIEFLLRNKAKAPTPVQSYSSFKEEQYNRLADHVRRHLDMDKLYEILKIETLKY